jgi:hypothetical protein
MKKAESMSHPMPGYASPATIAGLSDGGGLIRRRCKEFCRNEFGEAEFLELVRRQARYSSFVRSSGRNAYGLETALNRFKFERRARVCADRTFCVKEIKDPDDAALRNITPSTGKIRDT